MRKHYSLLSLYLFLWIEYVAIAQAQEALTHQDVSPSVLASNLAKNYAIVVYGEFDGESVSNIDESLSPKTISATFHVIRAYKGWAQGSLQIELMSDMLAHPGTNRSRYAMRGELLSVAKDSLEEIQIQIDSVAQSFDKGEIVEQEFNQSIERLKAERRQLIAEYSSLSGRQIATSHGKTFYERGGVIRPTQRYLIGLNGTLMLEEAPVTSPNIYWGELMDEIVIVLGN